MRKLEQLLRANILQMKSYSSARDDFSGSASIYLDANENPYQWTYSRYPDSKHTALKDTISSSKKVAVENIAIGNGSDELIDLLIRAFCEPSIDSIRILDPSYGMYPVSAQINNIAIEKEILNPDFSLQSSSILLGPDPKQPISKNEKIVFLCSPNNPTGNCFSIETLELIIQNYPGIVVIDEAYIDFADQASMIDKVQQYNNLVVLQTMSKAFASAGLRIGIAYANREIIRVLHKIKPPYNISGIAMNAAIEQWKNIEIIQSEIEKIKENRAWFINEIQQLNYVNKVFPSQANFVLCRITNATNLYKYLIQNDVVVRLRNNLTHCDNCIRFSIGTHDELTRLMTLLKIYENEYS